MSNDNLILISGKSATGKSASLMNLDKPDGVMYLNCESNKKLPFPTTFQQYNIVDPYQIYEAFTKAEEMPDIHTIVIDSLTFMMDMFESVHVIPATDGRAAWGDYAQFFKNLMQQYVAKSTKNVIFTGHTMDVYNEKEMSVDTYIKVKGSLNNNGIEAMFSMGIASKKLPLKELEPYKSPLLNITPEEEALGFKYVFQTKLTKATVNERIRSPMNMWSIEETYIDNDVQLVIDRLHQYY